VPTALVTGATGLVGSHIVERLRADGWTIRALLRHPASSLSESGVDVRIGDVLDADAFASAASGCEVIFHTAAAITQRGGWETYRRLNVDGTRNAVAAAARSSARLLQLSSVAVYGPSGRYRAPSEKTDEETPLGPLPESAFYARSKRESEEIVLGAHAAGRIWATAVRPDVIYGPRDRQFVPRVARLLRFGVAPLVDGGRSVLAIVHAANVADGAVLAATTDAAGGRAYNLANDGDVSVRTFVGLAAEGLGRRVRMVTIPKGVARIAFSAAELVTRVFVGDALNVAMHATLDMVTRDNPFTSDRARRELGWMPRVDPRVGIPEAFRWWLTHR
jgi:nucleoside-diphosphate-sugar epimerase